MLPEQTVPEEFLHFLWRWKRFDATGLLTTRQTPIEILHPGEWNRQHAGPDFFNARIRLGDTLWAGNVEIHLKSSDWIAHGHDADPAYDNVVLHVVLEEDQPVRRANGEVIPCLELNARIPPRVWQHYRRLIRERKAIPCQDNWRATPALIRNNWLDRMLVERLEAKTAQLAFQWQATHHHWEELCYRSLARHYGLKINTQPFEMLAESLSLRLISRHRRHLFQLEALLFGQAGMLAGVFSDDYPKALQKEYAFLSHKYGLSPLPPGLWKFLRLRPAGFPSIRLAQWAAFLHRQDQFCSPLLEAEDLDAYEAIFSVAPEGYWRTHYVFDKPSVALEKKPGKTFIHLLLANMAAPFLFFYGKTKKEERYVDKALHLLEMLPPERNTVLDEWIALGEIPQHSYQAQALLHLKNNWCDQRHCLQCGVGGHILLQQGAP